MNTCLGTPLSGVFLSWSGGTVSGRRYILSAARWQPSPRRGSCSTGSCWFHTYTHTHKSFQRSTHDNVWNAQTWGKTVIHHKHHLMRRTYAVVGDVIMVIWTCKLKLSLINIISQTLCYLKQFFKKIHIEQDILCNNIVVSQWRLNSDLGRLFTLFPNRIVWRCCVTLVYLQFGHVACSSFRRESASRWIKQPAHIKCPLVHYG